MHQKRTAFTFVEVLAVVVVVGLLILLLIPASRSSPEASRRNSCLNNLKQISLALLTYEEEHGEFPPAYTVDVEGNRLHSWRTLLLPYLEQQQLFDTIDLTKPWDDPANLKAREAVVEVYVCPSSTVEDEMTTYLGVFGADCFFSGSEPRKLSDVTDGTAQTLAVIEVSAEQAVHWMSPHDVAKDVLLAVNSELKSGHPGIVQAARVDGSVCSLSNAIDKQVLGGLLTINGGETIDPGAY